MMEPFVKIVRDKKLLTNFANSYIVDVLHSPSHTSDEGMDVIHLSEAYSELCQASSKCRFAKIVIC